MIKQIFVIISLLGLGIGIYFAMPKEVNIGQECDVTKADCSAQIEGHKISLSLKDRPFIKNEEIKMKVELSDKSIDRAYLFFFGDNMHMETEVVPLEKKSAGHFEAVRRLPTCTLDKMIWRVQLRLYQGSTTFKWNSTMEVLSE